MGAESERVAGFGRLEDGLRQAGDWYRWGPYVSERQWGTVREDYSANGEAWDYLPHDQARSRAYRWGEDGLAGFSDIEQRLCLGLALWNGRDPILKERAFGLTGSQGNHGEDVKEYWWYLDAVLAGTEASQLQWFTPAGTPMNSGDWADPNARAITIHLDGSDDPDRAQDGTPLLDDDFLVLVNSWWEPLGFVLPRTRPGAQWHAEIDSYDPAAPAGAPIRSAGDQVTVSPRSVIVLRADSPR